MLQLQLQLRKHFQSILNIKLPLYTKFGNKILMGTMIFRGGAKMTPPRDFMAAFYPGTIRVNKAFALSYLWMGVLKTRQMKTNAKREMLFDVEAMLLISSF